METRALKIEPRDFRKTHSHIPLDSKTFSHRLTAETEKSGNAVPRSLEGAIERNERLKLARFTMADTQRFVRLAERGAIGIPRNPDRRTKAGSGEQAFLVLMFLGLLIAAIVGTFYLATVFFGFEKTMGSVLLLLFILFMLFVNLIVFGRR